MSHFAFYSEPDPFDTRHGVGYVGIGSDNQHVESISIVTPGDDSTDLHLSPEQAMELIDQLASCVAVLKLNDDGAPS